MQACCGPFILLGNEPQPHHPRTDDRLPERRTLMTSWTLVGVVDGTVECLQGKKRHTLRTGGAILLPPGKSYAFRQSRAHYRFLVFDLIPQRYVEIRKGVWRHTDEQVQPNAQELWGCSLNHAPPAELLSATTATLRFCCDRWWRGVGPRMQAQARLGTFIANWVASVLQSTTTAQDLFAVAEDEAERRLPTGFNVDDMAQVCGMSRVVFTREYSRARGESPGVYLRRLRLEMAAELWKQPGWSLEHLAKHVGYCSSVTFSRAFKKYFGVTPRKWKSLERGC